MNPIISVVIPTYNRRQIVQEAFQSVFLQEPKNYEILVVDDGSTDGTVEYLESLCKLVPTIPVIIVKGCHKGIAAARNSGVKRAKGEFIAFLDSDDVWLPRILESQFSYLKCHSFVRLFTQTNI